MAEVIIKTDVSEGNTLQVGLDKKKENIMIKVMKSADHVANPEEENPLKN
jgi:hypothetical protein